MDQDTLRSIDRAICGDVWAGDSVARHLEALCLDCGSRFAGSESERLAVDLIAARWQAYGLQNVRAESFPFTAWTRGSAGLSMFAPAVRHYPCLALPFAPACSLEGDLVDLGYGMPDDYKGKGQAVRGKIALVKNGTSPGAARSLHRMEKYVLARDAGAVAFLFVDDQPGMLPPTGSLPFVQGGPLDQALPSMGLSYETGAELGRRAACAPVRLRMEMENHLAPGTSWNLIGEIPGQPWDGRPGLVVSAHLDGHDIGQGAIDNGSGVIAVDEIARVLAGHARQIRGPVRFALFGAEELGMLGSYAYTEAHAAEMADTRFVFNLDITGTGGGLGMAMQNSPELVPYFRQLGGELATEIQVSDAPVPFSDNFPFTVQGVPAAFIHSTGHAGPRGWAHTAADTLDKVDIQSIRLAAAAVARLVIRVAGETLPWPAIRRTPEQVEQALKTYGIESLLRAEMRWPF